MKGRALHKRMSQRRRCVAPHFKLQTSTVSPLSLVTLECDKRDGAVLCVFVGNSLNMVFSLLQKNLFKGM